MTRVLCLLPNASQRMNGVDFEAVDGGMLSAPLADEQAAYFLAVPGFEPFEEPKKTRPKPEPEA